MEGFFVAIVFIVLLFVLTWKAGSAWNHRQAQPPRVEVHTYQDDGWRYTPDQNKIVDAE